MDSMAVGDLQHRGVTCKPAALSKYGHRRAQGEGSCAAHGVGAVMPSQRTRQNACK